MDILLTAVVTSLIELVLHWFPWRLLLRRDMHPTATYIWGVCGIAIPLTVLWLHQGQGSAVLALWVVIVSAGLAVIAAYAIDKLIIKLARGEEAEELNEYRKAD